MRILIGTDTYPPDVNGASYFSRQLATGLAARGHEVHVLCPTATTTPADDGASVTVHHARSVGTPVHPTFRVSPPPYSTLAGRRTLDRVRPHVVHVQGHFPIGRALLHAARRRGLPVIATNHFMPENLLGFAPIPVPARARAATVRAAWRDFARVFRLADTVTTPTATAADLITAHGLAGPISVVSCGVQLDRFSGQTRRAAGWRGIPDRPTILSVSRLDAEKRLDVLIEALAVLRRRVDAQLVLVGTGRQWRQLRNLVTARGVDDAVVFTGFVPDDELPDAYRACDVFAIAGEAELQSLVTMEAMASGKPVVAADAVALPLLVRDGHNGYRFPPGGHLAAAARLQEILTDPPLAARLGANGRVTAHNHAIETTILRYEDIYRAASARPGTGPAVDRSVIGPRHAVAGTR